MARALFNSFSGYFFWLHGWESSIFKLFSSEWESSKLFNINNIHIVAHSLIKIFAWTFQCFFFVSDLKTFPYLKLSVGWMRAADGKIEIESMSDDDDRFWALIVKVRENLHSHNANWVDRSADVVIVFAMMMRVCRLEYLIIFFYPRSTAWVQAQGQQQHVDDPHKNITREIQDHFGPFRFPSRRSIHIYLHTFMLYFRISSYRLWYSA